FRSSLLAYAPVSILFFFSLRTRPPPISTLFPYTTLFRSLLYRTIHRGSLYQNVHLYNIHLQAMGLLAVNLPSILRSKVFHHYLRLLSSLRLELKSLHEFFHYIVPRLIGLPDNFIHRNL